MSFSTCPIATVNASVEGVWHLVSEPASYALWWDAETRSIIPGGPARAGQKIYAKTKGPAKQWDVHIVVEMVDEDKHQIDLTTMLPFGITVHNHITCTSHGDATCRVSFG